MIGGKINNGRGYKGGEERGKEINKSPLVLPPPLLIFPPIISQSTRAIRLPNLASYNHNNIQ